MPPMHVREEVLNVVLADLLSKKGLLSIPEGIRPATVLRKRRHPDVTIADLFGARIVIEGRFGNGSTVRGGLTRDAKRRVEEGISPICMAVIYPKALRSVSSLPDLRRGMRASEYEIRIISEGSDGSWSKGPLDHITDILRRSYELLVSEDVVVRAVEEIATAIEAASGLLIGAPAAPPKLREILGIPKDESPDPAAKALEDQKACRIASLTLINAMVFHEILAARNKKVPSLDRTAGAADAIDAFREAWTTIVNEIDYVPIFTVALEILTDLSGTPDFSQALKNLSRVARRTTGRRAALRHDLMGRIYHYLLADAKYFGAFYTTVPAASLLLKLTLNPKDIAFDWSSVESLRNLRVADLACGTGTLLKATLQTVIDNHVRSCGEKGTEPNLLEVHKALVEDALWGFDVIPFAIHLSASALALHEPDAEFGAMHLFTMPLGAHRKHIDLGSLDFIEAKRKPVQADLLGSTTGPGRVTGSGEIVDRVSVPQLDLCVMNPPFTRSVGGNLLFGNLPEPQRRRMQDELKRLVRTHCVPASITPGLGPVFAAIGHRFVRPGGHLALVLPRALLTGVAWRRTRELIGGSYHVRYIVVSHEVGRWNFSENASYSDCLLVARKLRPGEATEDTKVVNLLRQPTSSVEALTFAEGVEALEGAALEAMSGSDVLEIGSEVVAEVVRATSDRIRAADWGEEAAFAQTELSRCAFNLRRGRIYLPGEGIAKEIPIGPFGSLGEVGPDRRDIHDGFKLSSRRTAYAAFWGHDTERIRLMSQEPNQYLSALPGSRPGRPQRDANLLWGRAGRLLVAERLRLNTARIVAARCSEKGLSNTWWPVAVSANGSITAETIEKILVMWLNSSFGLISLIAARVDTEGAWVEVKKPILEALLVLDPTELGEDERQKLIDGYDRLARTELRQIPDVAVDDGRREIDSLFADALGVSSSLDPLRMLLAQEPLIRRGGTGGVASEEDDD